MSGVLLVLTNCPDADSAQGIARALVERNLAACVNQLAPVRSLYRWQGAIEEADEVPLLIKTAADRYPELERELRALHPYSVPEILAFDAERGLPDYLDWVAAETRPVPRSGA